MTHANGEGPPPVKPGGPRWVTMWGYEVAAKPSAAGVRRLRSGGYLVDVRVDLPKEEGQEKRKRKSKQRALPNATFEQARDAREELKKEVREEVYGKPRERKRFSQFSADLFERHVAWGVLKSEASIETWRNSLTNHLIPALGHVWCDQLERPDLDKYKDSLAKRINALAHIIDGAGKVRKNRERLSPVSANQHLSHLRVICKAMKTEFGLAVDPAEGLTDFDESTEETYTHESPNTLRARMVGLFFRTMMDLYPQHFATSFLGVIGGWRPSTLRPLRYRGPEPDVLWNENVILLRRSHTRRQVVMNTTKTKKRQRIGMPEMAMNVLRWHVALVQSPPLTAKGKPPRWWRPEMAESDLLFPALHGGFRASGVLIKPFRIVQKAMGLPYKLTPRAMRRAFQDLGRAAGVDRSVKRSISGHDTEEMEEHYSWFWDDEKRDALTRIIAVVKDDGNDRSLFGAEMFTGVATVASFADAAREAPALEAGGADFEDDPAPDTERTPRVATEDEIRDDSVEVELIPKPVRTRAIQREEPRELEPRLLPRFLAVMQEHWPQHYAMTFLGFVTGWGTSLMRPLRRRGENADIIWEKSVVLIRQSHIREAIVTDLRETAEDQQVVLPERVMQVLRSHVELLERQAPDARGRWPRGWTAKMVTSELLFPSEQGGLRTTGILNGQFREVSRRIGLDFELTPLAMRRTFRALLREANALRSEPEAEVPSASNRARRSEGERPALERVLDVLSRYEKIEAELQRSKPEQ